MRAENLLRDTTSNEPCIFTVVVHERYNVWQHSGYDSIQDVRSYKPDKLQVSSRTPYLHHDWEILPSLKQSPETHACCSSQCARHPAVLPHHVWQNDLRHDLGRVPAKTVLIGDLKQKLSTDGQRTRIFPLHSMNFPNWQSVEPEEKRSSDAFPDPAKERELGLGTVTRFSRVAHLVWMEIATEYFHHDVNVVAQSSAGMRQNC